MRKKIRAMPWEKNVFSWELINSYALKHTVDSYCRGEKSEHQLRTELWVLVLKLNKSKCDYVRYFRIRLK